MLFDFRYNFGAHLGLKPPCDRMNWSLQEACKSFGTTDGERGGQNGLQHFQEWDWRGEVNQNNCLMTKGKVAGEELEDKN